MFHILPYFSVLTPFFSFLIVGILLLTLSPVHEKKQHTHQKSSHAILACWITCLGMGISAATSLILLGFLPLETPLHLSLWEWIHIDHLQISFGILVDKTSLIMMTMVTNVSFLIHIYSVSYMHHDPSRARFMSYLSLFTFFMLILIIAPNLAQLFLGWEGVGLASYLLIGFWNHKASANSAAIKAFVTNRVGDAGFIVGLAGLFFLCHTLDITSINDQTTTLATQSFNVPFFGTTVPILSLICISLFIGVMGKSAQIGLHIWLPDAMEGPTPVSALIHAATMVTAGVYLLIRLFPLFELSPHVLYGIAVIGSMTCLFAASIALVQDDIKKIIAYSTCSQLGYMIMAVGMHAIDAAFFHLITHAFFKALLFLGAGAVIHAISDEQNIEKMGGLYRRLPFSYSMMWIGNLALAGVPFFSGFYSKDSILVSTFIKETSFSAHHSPLLFWIGILVAFMTALYSWRLLIKVFHGPCHVDDRTLSHLHEAPWMMRIPLIVLGLGAAFLGFFTETIFIKTHFHAPSWVLQIPVIVAIMGIGVAYIFFFMRPHLAFNLTRYMKYVYVILLNKWFFDKIYHKIFTQGALFLGNILWQKGDIGVIDRFGPDGISKTIRTASEHLRKLQSGYLYHYAGMMFLALTGIVFYLLTQYPSAVLTFFGGTHP